jgi:hypothetical protein
MPAGYSALIFCALAIAAAFGIRRDLQQGWARAGGFRFYADKNPAGYWLSVGDRGFVILWQSLKYYTHLGSRLTQFS